MSTNANYRVLGLTSDASWDEVKSAFRRMARLYHPDVAGPDGARKFTEITEAYMTLKESISPGASGSGGSASEHAAPHRNHGEASTKKESIFRLFWRKLVASFTRRKEEAFESPYEAYESDLPPVRVRFIGRLSLIHI